MFRLCFDRRRVGIQFLVRDLVTDGFQKRNLRNTNRQGSCLIKSHATDFCQTFQGFAHLGRLHLKRPKLIDGSTAHLIPPVPYPPEGIRLS